MFTPVRCVGIMQVTLHQNEGLAALPASLSPATGKAAAAAPQNEPAPTEPTERIPVWRIREGSLHKGLRNITVSSTTGPRWSVAVDLTEYNVKGQLSGAVITGNNASGMRLSVTSPWFGKFD